MGPVNNMAPMRVARLVLAPACLLTAAALLVACGGSGETDATEGNRDGATPGRPAPAESDFPMPAGRTLKEVVQMGDKPAALKIDPAAMVFYPGENRYSFNVFEPGGNEVTDAEVALYISRVPPAKPAGGSQAGSKGAAVQADAQALEEPAIGPFPAKIESLATEPEFRSATGPDVPEAARVVYSTQLDLPSEGTWRVAALVKEDGELGGTLLPGVVAGEFERVPRVGEEAPRIQTENKVDYAEVLGKEPIVLLFTTARFCHSRVCGPVLDQTERAEREYGDEAAFIHVDIYNDNNPDDGVRPQVRAFHLPTEPWLFTIDREGVIRDTIEGGFGTELLDEAIEKAIR